MDHCDFDPSLARAWTDLVVPSEATVVAQPCEGSLHDPTPWQNGKANHHTPCIVRQVLRFWVEWTGVSEIRGEPFQDVFEGSAMPPITASCCMRDLILSQGLERRPGW